MFRQTLTLLPLAGLLLAQTASDRKPSPFTGKVEPTAVAAPGQEPSTEPFATDRSNALTKHEQWKARDNELDEKLRIVRECNEYAALIQDTLDYKRQEIELWRVYFNRHLAMWQSELRTLQTAAAKGPTKDAMALDRRREEIELRDLQRRLMDLDASLVGRTIPKDQQSPLQQLRAMIAHKEEVLDKIRAALRLQEEGQKLLAKTRELAQARIQQTNLQISALGTELTFYENIYGFLQHRQNNTCKGRIPGPPPPPVTDWNRRLRLSDPTPR